MILSICVVQKIFKIRFYILYFRLIQNFYRVEQSWWFYKSQNTLKQISVKLEQDR